MKASVVFVPLALSDLAEVKQYIADELENPQASSTIVQRIIKRITSLKEFPNAGKLLVDYFGVRTGYRYLVCENYLIIYKYEKETVTIIRILYRKRDYINILFD
jgi:toxin ParE1/3/4